MCISIVFVHGMSASTGTVLRYPPTTRALAFDFDGWNQATVQYGEVQCTVYSMTSQAFHFITSNYFFAGTTTTTTTTSKTHGEYCTHTHTQYNTIIIEIMHVLVEV